MGISFETPLNTTQRISEKKISSRTVVQPSVHYTCPAGKKAIFKGIVQCTSLGAATNASLRDVDDAFNLARWTTATGTRQNVDWTVLIVGVLINVELELEAGDEIKTVQNSGTNAEFNVVGTVLELPA